MILLFAKENNLKIADVAFSPASDYRAIVSLFQKAPFLRR